MMKWSGLLKAVCVCVCLCVSVCVQGPFNPAPGQHGDNHGRERLLDALEASELIQPTSRSHTPAHPTLMGNAHAAQQQQRVHAGMCMAPAGVEGGERALSAAARRSPALPQGQFAMPPARPQHVSDTHTHTRTCLLRLNSHEGVCELSHRNVVSCEASHESTACILALSCLGRSKSMTALIYVRVYLCVCLCRT